MGEIKYRAVKYIRLSNADDKPGESNSITNQRKLIDEWLKKHPEIEVVSEKIDDGWSGLLFDRPAFTEMMEDIKKGVVNCCITKDMSRLGRDRLETGNYIEKIFPLQKVRYISILDDYDSLTGSNADIAPFKGLLDEMYAKDISRKVKGAFDAKRVNGEFIGAFAAYGYKKSSDNKNRLIPDEEAADVVRRIFQMFVSGISKSAIARILNSENIPCPTVYKNNKGLNYKNPKQFGQWTYSTISRILENRIYLGDMIQKKEETIFKTNGKKIINEEDKWIIARGTHEPVIDEETFAQAKAVNGTRTRRLNFQDNVTIYAGILKCADCGRAMSKTKAKSAVYYKCGGYKQLGKSYCSSHSLREDILDGIILRAVQQAARIALSSRDIGRLTSLLDIRADCKETKDLEAGLLRISRYKKKAYETFADGLLSKDEYMGLKREYEGDEEKIKEAIAATKEKNAALRGELTRYREYASRFIRYVDIDRLTREIMLELVEGITVYENKKIDIKFKFRL